MSRQRGRSRQGGEGPSPGGLVQPSNSEENLYKAVLRASEGKKDERDRVQKKTFTKWVNKHLFKAQRHVNDLYEDLRDGHNLISLLEVLSGDTLAQWSPAPAVLWPKKQLERELSSTASISAACLGTALADTGCAPTGAIQEQEWQPAFGTLRGDLWGLNAISVVS
ncbi:hypothetical protein Chor_010560 [Crotalus horridus]